MKEKIDKIIEKIESSEKITAENKPLILEKIKEWREEDNAISDVVLKLENWWLEVEPIFAEMGLV
jgi:predicted nucleic-acid-binding protein